MLFITEVCDKVLPAVVRPSMYDGEDALRLEATVLPLVRHLQEEQEGELFDVVDGGDAVVAHHVAEVDELADEPLCFGGAGGVGHCSELQGGLLTGVHRLRIFGGSDRKSTRL